MRLRLLGFLISAALCFAQEWPYYGGDAGGWTDVIDLSGVDVGSLAPGWLALTSGTVDEIGADYNVLSEDAAGTITLNDGSVMTFEGIERIEW